MILYLFIFLFLFIFFLKFCEFLCLPIPKFKFSPSGLYTFYGAPGSGKSTLAAYFAKRAQLAGIQVYSNLPIQGCRQFEKSDLGKWNIENCLVIWDEVGVDANSRNFKSNFTSDNIKWLKYHRHENAMVMVFSQGFDDMDKIIRTLSTDMFVVRRGFFNTITYRRIGKRPDIDEITHKPDDLYDFVPFSKKRIFAPRVWKMFNSYERLGLPDRESWYVFGAKDEGEIAESDQPDRRASADSIEASQDHAVAL